MGILCPNTPAFLEAIFGIAAAGAVNVAVNYRLKVEDVGYIFDFGEVCIHTYMFFCFLCFGGSIGLDLPSGTVLTICMAIEECKS